MTFFGSTNKKTFALIIYFSHKVIGLDSWSWRRPLKEILKYHRLSACHCVGLYNIQKYHVFILLFTLPLLYRVWFSKTVIYNSRVYSIKIIQYGWLDSRELKGRRSLPEFDAKHSKQNISLAMRKIPCDFPSFRIDSIAFSTATLLSVPWFILALV